MKKLKSHFEITQAQKIGISALLLFSGGLFLGLDYFKNHSRHQNPKVSAEDKKALLELQQQLNGIKKRPPRQGKKRLEKLTPFDPNQIGQKNWEDLGFSPKQATTILKYKKSLGGFSSLEQIKKCFVISDEKFQQLKPYIQLKEKHYSVSSTQDSPAQLSRKIKPFDPNRLEQEGWEDLGFSPKQATTILKYKKSLGGFSSLEQIKKCFVISDEKFRQLKPYIRLDNTSTSQDSKSPPSLPTKKDLNHADWKTLLEYTGQEKLAGRIISYKNALGGFVSMTQLKEVYDLPETSIEKLTANFEIADPKNIRKISINQADEKDLKKHPYLRPFAQKIIEHREKNGPFKEPEDIKKIEGLEKEKFQKVKLYLAL